jgi:heat shock protein HslJ
MNSFVKSMVLSGLAFFALAACNSGPKFTEVQDKEWRLIEVRGQQETITFDRSKLISEGFGNIFTLKLDPKQVSGMGAPNRYFGPYELGKSQAISFNKVAATLMAPIREPEKLKEHDYFAYLQNVYKWGLGKDANLELFTKSEDGQEAVMVFVLQ